MRVAKEGDWDSVARNYLFVCHFRRQHLQAAIEAALAAPRIDGLAVEAMLQYLWDDTGLEDDGPLVRGLCCFCQRRHSPAPAPSFLDAQVRIFHRREADYNQAWANELLGSLIQNVENKPEKSMPTAEVIELLECWSESMHYRAPESLADWGASVRLQDSSPSIHRTLDLLSWSEMKEVLRRLPTSL